jgi:metal-responsive CopG/Arc/MetJ family transcriptional regulator
MKVAISLPDDVFDAAERLARQRKLSRSELYVAALTEYLATNSEEAVTAKLNQLYASEPSCLDPPWVREQAKVLADEAW